MFQQGFDAGEDAVRLVAKDREYSRRGQCELGVEVGVLEVFAEPVVGYEGRQVVAVTGKGLINAKGEIMPVFLFFLRGVRSSMAGSVRSCPSTDMAKNRHRQKQQIGINLRFMGNLCAVIW